MKKLNFDEPLVLEGFVNLRPEGTVLWVMKPFTYEASSFSLLQSALANCMKQGEPLEPDKPRPSTRSIWRKTKHYFERGRNNMQFRYFKVTFVKFSVDGMPLFGPLTVVGNVDFDQAWLRRWQELYARRDR